MTCDEIASYSGEQREDFFSNKGSYQSLYFRLILQPTPPPPPLKRPFSFFHLLLFIHELTLQHEYQN